MAHVLDLQTIEVPSQGQAIVDGSFYSILQCMPFPSNLSVMLCG